jgi:prophage antirepressor-like protein
MSAIIPFQFNGLEIVAITDDQGVPWWKASDVCQQCEIKNVSKACDRLDPDEKAVITLSDIAGRPQEMLVVNEYGLYGLVLSSRKPEAKVFKRWIKHEVLPSIRKTGKYESASALDHYPDLQAMSKLLVTVAETRDIAEAAKTESAQAKTESAQANANANRALETQLYFTIAEYVYTNKLERQLPRSAYKAASDHLAMYCKQHNVPVRQIPVWGQSWKEELGFHVQVYADVFHSWLKRRYSQESFKIVPHNKAQEE